MMYRYSHNRENNMACFFLGATSSALMFLGYKLLKNTCCNCNENAYMDLDEENEDEYYEPEYVSSALHVNNVSRCRRTHNLINRMNRKVNGNTHRCKMRKRMYNRINN